MELLIINIQSESDIITNSSSELFVLNTDDSAEKVNNLLNYLTTGFKYPYLFNLKDFRESKKINDERLKKMLEMEEVLSYDEYNKWVKSEYPEEDEKWEWDGIYNQINGYFIDLDDEEELFKYRLSELSSRLYYQEDQDCIVEYYESNNKNPFIDGRYIPYAEFEDNFDRNFFSEFERLYPNDLPKWWNPNPIFTLQSLDGKLLVLSEGDNSIPYDDFDKIRDLFNAYNIHLG